MTEIDDQTLERIIAWTEGELDDDAHAAFEAELDRDPALQAAVDAYMATIDALPTLDVEAPADFEQRVQRRIRRRSRGRFFNPEQQQQRMQAAVFAAIAALVLGGIALFSSSGPIRLLWTDEGSGESAPDEGSSDGSGGRLHDEPTPTGPSDGPDAVPEPAAGAPSLPGVSAQDVAATSGVQTVDPMRVSWAYTVQTELDVDTLRARLDDQFGDAVRVTESGFEVVVPAREHREVLRALGPLGAVSRVRTERPAVLTERVFTVLPAATD